MGVKFFNQYYCFVFILIVRFLLVIHSFGWIFQFVTVILTLGSVTGPGQAHCTYFDVFYPYKYVSSTFFLENGPEKPKFGLRPFSKFSEKSLMIPGCEREGQIIL